MLLAQPINRKTIFLAEFLAVSGALSLAFLLGVGVPAFGAQSSVTLYLLGAGDVDCGICCTCGLRAAVSTVTKPRPLASHFSFWFYFSLIYDGLILYVIYSFSDYPWKK